MKLIILGNAGSGKSTLARHFQEAEELPILSLDSLAFSDGPERRPLAESIEIALKFINAHSTWVIEGCYANIISAILSYADKLIFLNPGIEACVRLCRQRKWEPEKYSSAKQQSDNLNYLINWVREYDTRKDEYGLDQHRDLFSRFTGEKIEYTDLSQYKIGSKTAQRVFLGMESQ